MKESPATTFTGLCVLLIASAISAGIFTFLSPVVPDPEKETPPKVMTEALEMGLEIINADAMKEIVDSGSYLILDARSRTSFDKGHIPTAVSAPVQNFEESFPEILPLLETGMPVVVYCSGPLCSDGLRLIERLQEVGYPGAALFLGGLEGWNE